MLAQYSFLCISREVYTNGRIVIKQRETRRL
nr:MAG TPA: hypothetical protein [Caudoviricetes sp.]